MNIISQLDKIKESCLHVYLSICNFIYFNSLWLSLAHTVENYLFMNLKMPALFKQLKSKTDFHAFDEYHSGWVLFNTHMYVIYVNIYKVDIAPV